MYLVKLIPKFCFLQHGRAFNVNLSNSTTLFTHSITKRCSRSFIKALSRVQFSMSSLSWQSKHHTLSDTLLESWHYEVDPFGRLHLNVPFDVEIHSHHEMNKAVVQVARNVTTKGETDQLHDKTKHFVQLYDLKIKVEEKNKKMTVTAKVPTGVNLPVICNITVPIKFDLEVVNEGIGNITLKDIESADMDIQLNKGTCYLRNIKSNQANISTREGSIISQSVLQGNLNLTTHGNGEIRGDRFQGTNITCVTKTGDIDVKTIYGDANRLLTDTGNVHLGSCHGNTDIEIHRGNLHIDTLDGNLAADIDEGLVDIYITRHERINIGCSAGDITLKVPEELISRIELSAENVSVDPKLNLELQQCSADGKTKYKGVKKETESGSIIAKTKQGKIFIKLHDWLSSIGLHFGKKTED